MNARVLFLQHLAPWRILARVPWSSAILALAIAFSSHAAPLDRSARIRGLLIGSAIGDALGGPIEFQDPDAIRRLPTPPARWTDSDVLDGPARAAAAGRLRLRRYDDLRPQPESYGHWNTNSLPGTVTDDTRHKFVLLAALHRAHRENSWPLDRRGLAKAHLDWPGIPAVARRADYTALAGDWLEEWQFAARWILGDRDSSRAKPPERMWQGLPTCSGQMSLLPLAAVYAGDPERAYLAAYELGFFDNGYGKDLNAALVAALAAAIVVPVDPARPAAAWGSVLDALRKTDPFAYAKIRWTERSVDRWLNLALGSAKRADHRPSRLFADLEAEFRQTTKWEAQVPFTVVFACFALAEFDPLASLQLTLEWGHDSDSYAQVAGAFVGALHGPDIFPKEWIAAVTDRARADFGIDLEHESRFLHDLHLESRSRNLVTLLPK